jgi:hypothetical protein
MQMSTVNLLYKIITTRSTSNENSEYIQKVIRLACYLLIILIKLFFFLHLKYNYSPLAETSLRSIIIINPMPCRILHSDFLKKGGENYALEIYFEDDLLSVCRSLYAISAPSC